MNQTSFLPGDDHGIRRAPAEQRPRTPPPSAPLAKDGQALVMGSLTTGARYEPRCLVCGAWLTEDMQPPRYPVPICASCARTRGGKV